MQKFLRPISRQVKALRYINRFLPRTLFLFFFKNQLSTSEINYFKQQLKSLHFSTIYLLRRLVFVTNSDPLLKNELFFSQVDINLDDTSLFFYQSFLSLLKVFGSAFIKHFGQFPNVYLNQMRLRYILGYDLCRRFFSLDFFLLKIRRLVYVLVFFLLKKVV